jgi:hypothetical protein
MTLPHALHHTIRTVLFTGNVLSPTASCREAHRLVYSW